MKTLLLMRHAHAEAAAPGQDDHQRGLGARGGQAASRVGRLLRDEGVAPDHIVSSTAERARATAAAVAVPCGYAGEIRLTRRLYGGNPLDYLHVLRTLSDAERCVLLVGHNPAAEELLRLLTGCEEGMPPATVARLLLPVASWAELDEDTLGRLAGLWRPGDLP